MFAFKPDFEQSQQRMEAFWEHQVLDRPVVQFSLSRPPSERVPMPPAHSGTPTERWLDVDYQVATAVAALSNQEYLGDTLPVAWPNFGPDILAALYGCPLEFGDFGTSWSSPIITQWDQAGTIHLDWTSPLLARLEELTAALLQAGEGHFITGMTDWHTGGDCLAALRGPLALAVDLLESPGEVQALLTRIESDFFALYDHFYTILRSAGQPITTWTPLVSDGKYYLPANDFSALISPEMFAQHFLPGIVRQCQFLDCSMYHLDGPDALRHLDCLLQIPELDAIQYVPSPGQAEVSRWVDVYQRIQASGKSLQVTCEIGEIEVVMQTLQPEGLYLVVNGVPNRNAGNAILAQLSRWCLHRPHGGNR